MTFGAGRATAPDPLSAAVLRRAVRELPVLAKVEERRMAELGMEDRWEALGTELSLCGAAAFPQRARSVPAGPQAATPGRAVLVEPTKRVYRLDARAPA